MTGEGAEVSRGEDSREVRRRAISNCSNREAFLEVELMSKVLESDVNEKDSEREEGEH
jgi:chromosome condensin MukBEF MukE localization factor